MRTNTANHSGRSQASQLNDILDEAYLVKCDVALMKMAVWKGGTTINFYGLETLQPQTCFTLDDGEGNAEDREAVEEHIEELFEEEREKLLGDE